MLRRISLQSQTEDKSINRTVTFYPYSLHQPHAIHGTEIGQLALNCFVLHYIVMKQ